ncbi:MAG TPA: GNAT family N-acetyltransferase [Chitinophagaceae bacterium]|nr:GNAT family N-acetyltransferase [Chitinophagaceae bacterium]
MDITYRYDIVPTPDQVIALYEDSGLPRPTTDKQRIRKMYEHSNLIVTAWDKTKLVGVSRSITDWAWSCYLADLAVSPEYKKSGIGKKLIELTKEKVGDQVMILLLSVPTAMTYYPKIGFTKEDRAFAIFRSE